PVRITTGVPGDFSATVRATSSPLASGNPRSERTRSNDSWSNAASPSPAVAVTCGRWPRCVRPMCRKRRMLSSSSTTRMRNDRSGAGCLTTDTGPLGRVADYSRLGLRTHVHLDGPAADLRDIFPFRAGQLGGLLHQLVDVHELARVLVPLPARELLHPADRLGGVLGAGAGALQVAP